MDGAKAGRSFVMRSPSVPLSCIHPHLWERGHAACQHVVGGKTSRMPTSHFIEQSVDDSASLFANNAWQDQQSPAMETVGAGNDDVQFNGGLNAAVVDPICAQRAISLPNQSSQAWSSSRSLCMVRVSELRALRQPHLLLRDPFQNQTHIRVDVLQRPIFYSRAAEVGSVCRFGRRPGERTSRPRHRCS